MTETLTFTPHRTISSITILAVALVIAASMALGFGIRTWTQTTTQSSGSAAVRTAPPAPVGPAGSDTQAPMLRINGPH